MVGRWLSDAFQRLLRIFSGNQPEEEDTQNEPHEKYTHTHATAATAATATQQERARRSREPNEELFDNKWRREASEHAQLRSECFKKADEAREAGDHAAANEYVKEAKEHTQKMNEANERAVRYIMEKNPNNTADTIDLHGLHVEEALEQAEKKLKSTTEGVLHIIPGRGSHSVNQQARIKPKLIQYLKDNNYKFSEDNPGSLSVQLP